MSTPTQTPAAAQQRQSAPRESSAAVLAARLVVALQAEHSALCKDTPNAAEHYAQAFLLELLADAVLLRNRIRAGGML